MYRSCLLFQKILKKKKRFWIIKIDKKKIKNNDGRVFFYL